MSMTPDQAIDLLEQSYAAFRAAEARGDAEGMEKARYVANTIEQALGENDAYSEAESRQQRVDDLGPLGRVKEGAKAAGMNILRASSQLADKATNGTMHHAFMPSKEQAAFEDLVLQTRGGMAGEFAVNSVPAMVGAGLVGHATKGLPLLGRAASQSALGAAELPLMSPAYGDNFWAQKAAQAGLGMFAGATGEAVLGGGPALARNALSRSGSGKPAFSSAPSMAESIFDANEIPLLQAERAYLRDGATEGMGAMQEASRLQGSGLQSEILQHKNAQQTGVESILSRRMGGDSSQAVGERVSYRLLDELSARDDAEQAAWRAFRSEQDAPILEASERTELLEAMSSVLKEKRVSVSLADELKNLRQYLADQLADPMGMTVGGLDNLRRDINSYWKATKNNPEANSVVSAMRREYEKTLDRILSNAQSNQSRSELASRARDAVSLSRRNRELYDGQTKLRGGRWKDNELSVAVRGLESGTIEPDAFVRKLVAGTGKARQFLREVEQVMGSEAASEMRSELQAAALRNMIGGKVRGTTGALELKASGGFKGLADTIDAALSKQEGMLSDLFSPSEIQELRDFASALRAITPPPGTMAGPSSGPIAGLAKLATSKVPVLGGEINETLLERNLRRAIYGESNSAPPVVERLLKILARDVPDYMRGTATSGASVAQ